MPRQPDGRIDYLPQITGYQGPHSLVYLPAKPWNQKKQLYQLLFYYL
jgi:hypothetical protein